MDHVMYDRCFCYLHHLITIKAEEIFKFLRKILLPPKLNRKNSRGLPKVKKVGSETRLSKLCSFWK